jgi:hypothetical protein
MTEDARQDAEDLAPETGEETFDFKLDRNNLFQEETFTDIRSGSVKRFTPIRPDGTPDKSRNTIYVGQTNLYTPDGPLPIQNVIAAKDLAQAFKRFPDAMEQAVQRLVEESKNMKEQETSSPIIQTPQSRIIVP